MKWLGYIFLLFTAFLYACEAEVEQSSDQDTDTVVVTYPEEDGTPPQANRNNTGTNENTGQHSLTVSNNDFVSVPFTMKNITRQNLRQRFDDYRVVKAEPTENRHIQGQMDTIFTINAGNSVWKIYQADTKEMLQTADINSRDVPLKQDIRLNMSTDAFVRALDINADLASNAAVTVEHSIVPSYLEFKFSNDQLQHIHYHGYVD